VNELKNAGVSNGSSTSDRDRLHVRHGRRRQGRLVTERRPKQPNSQSTTKNALKTIERRWKGNGSSSSDRDRRDVRHRRRRQGRLV